MASSEKTPALYVSESPFDEKVPSKTSKCCSKPVLSFVLAAILIALVVALCVQFLVPFTHFSQELDTVRVYDGESIDVQFAVPAVEATDENTTHIPWRLDFLIDPTRLCETVNPPESEAYRSNPEIKLLVLVPSAVGHFEQRSAIRNTWGSVSVESGSTRLGFVLGTTTNTTEEAMILKESESFGDIIQADFEDQQKNLTTKSVLMLKWVSEHCPHAAYILKTEDDAFVNLDVVARILQKKPYQTQDKFIGGFVHSPSHPSMLPLQDYILDDEFPPFVSGPSYLTSGPTAVELFEASKQMRPFLPFEDVFVTGLCADSIDASLVHEPSFGDGQLVRPLSWDSLSNVATAHSLTPDEIQLLWDQMNEALRWVGLLPGDDPRESFLGNPNARRTDSDLFDFPEMRPFAGMLDTPNTRSFLDLFKIPKGKKHGKHHSKTEAGLSSFPETSGWPEDEVMEGGKIIDSGPLVLGSTRITIHLVGDGDSEDFSPNAPIIPEDFDFPEIKKLVESRPVSSDFKRKDYVSYKPEDNPFNVTLVLFK